MDILGGSFGPGVRQKASNKQFCFSKEVVSDFNLTNELLFKFACSSSEEVPL